MQKKTTKKKRTLSSKSKQRPQRLKTFHQSDFSLLQQNNHLGSISDLFKNQAIKKKPNHNHNPNQINFNSTINNYTSVYTVISSIPGNKSQKQKSFKTIIKNSTNVQKKKAPQKCKSKTKINPDKKQIKKKKNKNQHKIQPYEHIPQSKNSLNSEIVFSIEDTKRQSDNSYKTKQQSSRIFSNYLSSKTGNQNLINTNKMLRSTIKQQFKRKNDAAIKIQKVFRGFLTRKILQKYIREEQQKLNQLLAEYKSSNQKKLSEKINSNKKNNQYDFFSNKNSVSERQHTFKTFQDQQSINLSKINASNFRENLDDSKASSDPFYSYRIASNREDIVNCEDQIDSSEQESQEAEQNNENLDQQEMQQEQEQSSDGQMIVYRHHQPIYSERSKIAQYLQSSSQDEQQLSKNNQKLKNLYTDHVIFQTNEQHIQSRKNSLLNKQKNKNSFSKKEKEVDASLNLKTDALKIVQQTIQSQIKNQMSQKLQFPLKNQNDFIKTSKLSSIHNTSRNNQNNQKNKNGQSINKDQIQKLERSPQSKQERNLTQKPNNELEQKTSKKSCKISIPNNKRSLNVELSSSSQFNSQKSQKIIYQSQSDNLNDNLNLQTIKLSNEEYAFKKIDQKKVFMDTISYNSQFKTKHNLRQPQSSQSKIKKPKLQENNNRKSQDKQSYKNTKQDKRKDLIKKKIYYFQDSSDQGQLQSSSRKKYLNNNQQNEQKFDFHSIQREYLSKCTNNQFQLLKNTEIKKWDEIIKLIHKEGSNISSREGTTQIGNFINQVMELSLKNKQMLKDMIFSQNQQSQMSERSSYKKSESKQKYKNTDTYNSEQGDQKLRQFRQNLSNGRRKSITQQDIAIFKPTNSRAKILTKQHKAQQKDQNTSGNNKQKATFFKQPKQQLKEKINKIQKQNFKHAQQKFNIMNALGDNKRQLSLLNNIQNDHIEQMLNIRQQMLQKKQCEQLTKLNQKLIKKEISQANFLEELKKLTQNFQNQKLSIDKAREDISKGYNATVKLIKEAFLDAKKIGYKLPLSKSSDSYKLNKHLGFGVLKNLNTIIIDELNSKALNFQMKHVASPQNQIQSQRSNLSNNKNTEGQANVITTKKDSLQQQKTQTRIQNDYKPFVRSQKISQKNIQNNQSIMTVSQSSSSIINNLSSNSFKDQYFQTQNSPKHQPLRQPSYLHIKNDIFNSNTGQFQDLSQQSSDIQFSQEQLKRFRKAQPYDPSIADMNRNLMIGRQFVQMQKNYQNNHLSSCEQQSQYQSYKLSANNSGEETQNFRLRLYRQVYQIQQNDSQPVRGSCSSLIQSKKYDPKIDLLTQKYIEFLIFEISYQILMKPLFSQKFLSYKRQQMFGIKKVSDQSRKQFIKIVQNILPSDSQLLYKLNQNISPLPKQLLKCMRIDFSEQDQAQNQQDQEYEQIGKYQMILDQQLCNQAIQKYQIIMQKQRQEQKQIQLLTKQSIENLTSQYSQLLTITTKNQQEKIFGYLSQREKFVNNRKQHCEGIRWEFINMELHCVFDAWNQQIIQLKSNKTGFSGIGLNQLTLSMIDRNQKINSNLVEEIMEESRYKVMKILRYENQIIDQLYKKICGKQNSIQKAIKQQNSSVNEFIPPIKNKKSILMQMKQYSQKYSWIYEASQQIQQQIDLDQQSKWVYYSDQALSYGLELVYLIEQQIFGQVAKQLRKSMLKLNFS